VACSGIAVGGRVEEWTRLAGEDARLAETLERLYYLFRDAPTLGSLINPAAVPLQQRLFSADYAEVEPLLKRALSKRRAGSADDPAAAVFGAAAEGIARAATLLSGTYTLIATNVPYLLWRKQGDVLQAYCRARHQDAKSDLATVFVERCLAACTSGGTAFLVTPQNWFFLGSYKRLRQRLLKSIEWNLIARLGAGAFSMIGGEVVNVSLIVLSNSQPRVTQVINGLDVSEGKLVNRKVDFLQNEGLQQVNQSWLLTSLDAPIVLREMKKMTTLDQFADSYQGTNTSDDPRVRRFFFEMPCLTDDWHRFQDASTRTTHFGGLEGVLLWGKAEYGLDSLIGHGSAVVRGRQAWGRQGIAVRQMGSLPANLYLGDYFVGNIAALVPRRPELLPALWAFCSSPQFNQAVREIDQAMKVTNATLVKVPFDLAYWQAVADAARPLPEPYSNDPTQWLFKGQAAGSTDPLQVAVARLLGYRWPQQPAEPDALDALADNDGIVCVPPVAGHPPAAERLRALLAAAYGEDWSPAQQERLLAAVGFGGKGLETWLRDGFFAGHCRLFHNRPFIWQVWDGRKDGFSALLNYHRLDAACLDRLIHSYLDRWIDAQGEQRQQAERQGADVSPELVGAGARLVAAQRLKAKLRAIREGEATPDRKDGYDIYVRWKPLHRQPLGWAPDLNDGVRLNVRPFVRADVLRNRFTVNWNKDRGHNPDGSERLNDLHHTLAAKRAACAAANDE